MPEMTLDTALYPFAGPCAFCGHPDKRHRMFDSLREMARAGDCAENLAEWFDLTVEQVEWVIEQPRFPVCREVREATDA